MTNFFFLLFWPFFRFLILRVVMLISWRYFRFRAVSWCLILPISWCYIRLLDAISDSVLWCCFWFRLLMLLEATSDSIPWRYFRFCFLMLLLRSNLYIFRSFEFMYIPFLWIYIYLNCFCFWQANKVNDYYYICDIWEYYLFCTIFSMYMEKGLFVKC